MPTLQQLSAAQTSPEIPLNENFETIEHQAVYGKRHPVTTGLTWGYYGGRWSGFLIAAGTFTLTASATNHIVVAKATGVTTCTVASTNWDNATDYARVYKLTTSASAVTAVEDHRAGSGGVHGGAGASGNPIESIIIAASDETTAVTAGTAKVTFRMPYAFTLSGARCSLTTAQTSGAIFTVDVNEAGATILSTKLTIDNTERTSTTATTTAVISDTALADDAEITVDIDQIGDGTAKGLKVTLIGARP